MEVNRRPLSEIRVGSRSSPRGDVPVDENVGGIFGGGFGGGNGEHVSKAVKTVA